MGQLLQATPRRRQYRKGCFKLPVAKQLTATRRPQSGKRGRMDEHKRRAVCEEAARIMADESVRDFQLAKHKACEHLGLNHRRTPLPTNREIESAVLTRLRLFSGQSLADSLREIRRQATELMHLFAAFRPRLVGALLRGNITLDTRIELHMFAENPEDVADHLDRNNIPCQVFDKRVRFAGNRFVRIPGFRFSFGEKFVELLIFSTKQLREAPICPIEGKPMRRANLREVETMVMKS